MNSKALTAAAKESFIEAAKRVPGLAELIEGVRKYRDTIEEQQRVEFVALLSSRIKKLEDNSEWYKTETGEKFMRKVVATALNGEYSDKLEFLANSLVNGPSLGNDDATRLKFVDMIRSVSKPSLDALIAFMKHSAETSPVLAGNIAKVMNWTPELADACISELHSVGIYSSVSSWRLDRYSDTYEVGTYLSDGRCTVTKLTAMFVDFISLD